MPFACNKRPRGPQPRPLISGMCLPWGLNLHKMPVLTHLAMAHCELSVGPKLRKWLTCLLLSFFCLHCSYTYSFVLCYKSFECLKH
jgi:hypothetical protein